MIRRGDPFYYLPDQDPGRNKGVFALFYSIPTATFPALGRIARMSNSIVIPCATVLLPWGQGYEIIFNQPLTDYPSGDDVQDATQMNQAIEALIAYAPQQYLWSTQTIQNQARRRSSVLQVIVVLVHPYWLSPHYPMTGHSGAI